MKASAWIVRAVLGLGTISLLFSAAVAAPDSGATPADAQVQPPTQSTDGAQPVAPAPVVPAKVMQLTDYLQFDAGQKEAVAANGEAELHFTFYLTNVSQEPVTIHKVATSCGCTTVRLPPMPWVMAAGTNGELNVTMNLAGKMGVVFKNVTVSTDKGTKVLLVKATIMPMSAASTAVMGSRESNQKMALADRQAVFHGDCARCHVEPGVGKMGKELYLAVCGICHEAEHRATMVPDLHNLPHETSRELWNVWITYGKPGSLMPAFSMSEGGSLSIEQIRSLADYLATTIPSRPAGQSAPPAAK